MAQTLREFLREYGKGLSGSILDGTIRGIKTDRSHKNLYFETEFEKYIPFAELIDFEAELTARLELESARILCRYPAALFSVDILPDLFLNLKRYMPLMNGFLEEAGLTLEQNTLYIELKHGGAEILETAHFRSELAKAVSAIYGIGITVEFSGSRQHLNNEDLEQMQADVLASLPPDRNYIPPEPAAPAQPVFSAVETAVTPEKPVLPPKEDLSVLFGRAVKEKPVSVAEVVSQVGSMGGTAKRFSVAAEVFAKPESRVLKNGKTLVTFPVTDYTGSILVKIFLKEDEVKDFPLDACKKGASLLIYGRVEYSEYDRDITITPAAINSYTPNRRTDDAPVKRVELHLHTNMSAMDAVSSAEALCNRAHEWGHRAIAITDHGVVQAFPEAMNAVAKWKDFRVIYGCEAYVVDDLAAVRIIDEDDPRTPQDEVICFDVETTGLSPKHDRLTEIGAVKIRGMRIVDSFDIFVNPERDIPQFLRGTIWSTRSSQWTRCCSPAPFCRSSADISSTRSQST